MSNPTPTSAHPRIPKRRLRQWWRNRFALPARAAGQIPDISEFQGAVDWDALLNAYRSGTIQGVIMRAGFGTTRADYQFYRNRDSARARGIPRAFYWYNYPTYNSPGAEAATFNSVVGALQPGEAMIGDFEESGLTAAWGAAFLTATESPQANTLWYGSPYFVGQWGLGSLRASWQYWIADYGVSSPPMTNGPVMWQYTDRGFNQWDTSVMLSGRFTDLLIPGGPAPAPDPGPSLAGISVGDRSMSAYPLDPTRQDFAYIGADGACWFATYQYGKGITQFYSLGGACDSRFAPMCCWTSDGSTLDVIIAGAGNGQLWLREWHGGAWAPGWAPMMAYGAGMVAGLPPAAAPYDDSAIKAAEAALQQAETADAAAIAALQPANVSDLAARITKIEAELQAVKDDL